MTELNKSLSTLDVYSNISSLTQVLECSISWKLDEILAKYTNSIIAASLCDIDHYRPLVNDIALKCTPHNSLEVVINKLIEGLLKLPQHNLHILTHGYQLTIGLSVPLPGTTLLECTHCNDAVHYILTTPQWSDIFQCLGHKFCYLLVNYALFIPLINHSSCYQQITGHALSRLPLPSAPVDYYISDLSKPRKPNNLLFSRLSKLHKYKLKRTFYGHNSSVGVIKSVTTRSVTNDDVKQLALNIFDRNRCGSKKWHKRLFNATQAINLSQLIQKYKSLQYDKLLPSEDNHTSSEMSIKQLVDNNTSLQKIVQFVISALLKTIPKVAWGSPQNKQHLFKAIVRLLSLGKQETLRICDIITGLKISEYTWLRPNYVSGNKRPHPPPSQSTSEEIMLCLWIQWLIEDFVFPLLNTYFYITEKCGATRNAIFYYKKSVWNAIKDIALQDIIYTRGMLQPQKISSDFNYSSKSLGISLFRFQPKPNGVRPITNLSHTLKECKQVPINVQLKNVLHVLKYEASSQPDILGSSVFGFDEIYKKLKTFIHQQHLSTNPWYMISVDIKDCFDSILSDLLIKLLKQTLTQKEYNIRKFAMIKFIGGQLKSFNCQGCDGAIMTMFPQFITKCCPSLRNTILVDQVKTLILDRDEVLYILESHLTCNLIKINGQYYRQIKGIPQGSILSTLLCCLYYADMEKKYIDNIVGSEGLLMRLVDDFLLLTQNSSVAHNFDLLMSQGIKEYNCFINNSKTVRNYYITDDGHLELIEDMEWFSWCGLLFNTKNMQIQTDYTRYTNIRSCMTIPCGSPRPLNMILKKTIRSMTLRCMPILLDSELIPEPVVLRNIYENFIISAMKFHCFVKDIILIKQTEQLAHVLLNVIVQCTNCFYNHSKTRCLQVGTEQSLFKIPRQMCIWLALKAFYIVLKRKQTRYKKLLSLLSHKLQLTHDHLDERSCDLLQDTAYKIKDQSIFKIKY